MEGWHRIILTKSQHSDIILYLFYITFYLNKISIVVLIEFKLMYSEFDMSANEKVCHWVHRSTAVQ